MPIIDKDSEILKILKESKKIAVIGITSDPLKAGHFVPKTLKEKGFEIFGVNPKYKGDEILQSKVYGSLTEIEDNIDVILVFRPPQEVPEIAKEALLKGFRTFWMQPQTTNNEVREDLNERGFNVISERCMKKESERLLE